MFPRERRERRAKYCFGLGHNGQCGPNEKLTAETTRPSSTEETEQNRLKEGMEKEREKERKKERQSGKSQERGGGGGPRAGDNDEGEIRLLSAGEQQVD